MLWVTHYKNKIDKMKYLKRFNESDRSSNRYMFFGNLQQIKRQSDILSEIDESVLDSILNNGHDWASDHISVAKENIDQVFDFIMNKVKSNDHDNTMIIDSEKEPKPKY